MLFFTSGKPSNYLVIHSYIFFDEVCKNFILNLKYVDNCMFYLILYR